MVVVETERHSKFHLEKRMCPFETDKSSTSKKRKKSHGFVQPPIRSGRGKHRPLNLDVSVEFYYISNRISLFFTPFVLIFK